MVKIFPKFIGFFASEKDTPKKPDVANQAFFFSTQTTWTFDGTVWHNMEEVILPGAQGIPGPKGDTGAT